MTSNAYHLGYQLAADYGDVEWVGDWPWTPGMRDCYGRRLLNMEAVVPSGDVSDLGLVWVAGFDLGEDYEPHYHQIYALDDAGYPDPVPDLTDEATLGAAKAMGEVL